MSIDADALRALRMALQFVERAAGEGICFVADAEYPEMDAAEVCLAASEALGIELGGPAYNLLIGNGLLPDLIHRSTISEETARAGEAMRERCLGLVQVEIDAVSRLEDDLIETGGENDSLSYAGHRASLQMMAAAIRALHLTEEAAHVER